jgi:hypothetical protein
MNKEILLKSAEQGDISSQVLLGGYYCEEIMFCKKCGAQIDADSVFCNKCGANQGVAQEITAIPTETPQSQAPASGAPSHDDFPETPASEFRYGYNEYVDGIIIERYNPTSQRLRVRIPESIEGMPVKAIGKCAFQLHKELISIKIPESITVICALAFSLCKKLESITIPDSVTTIEQLAFSKCTGLTSIVIPESVTNMGFQVFYGCERLKSIQLPYRLLHMIYEYTYDSDKKYSWNYEGEIKVVKDGVISTLVATAKEGDVIQFGGLDWRVLEVTDNGFMYILSEKILSYQPYHQESYVAEWNHCTLRKYLQECYEAFTPVEDKERIIWFNNDYIKLLLICDVEWVFANYFGRAAQDLNGNYCHWWLLNTAKSKYKITAAEDVTIFLTNYVQPDGQVVKDVKKANMNFGVRPAMWIAMI